MGHNRKNANRTEAINRNAEKLETNRKEIAKLRAEFRKNKTERDREILDLERRVLGELATLAETLFELADEFEAHRVPFYRKTIAHLRGLLRLDELDVLDNEIIDLDFEEDDKTPHYLGAVEIDRDPDNLDPALGDPVAVAVAGGQEDDGRAEGEPGTSDAPADEPDPILARLHDPEEVLKRLEARLEAENGIAADLMENQELDQEERAELMDRAITNIEQFKSRIAHQKLIIDGIVEAP